MHVNLTNVRNSKFSIFTYFISKSLSIYVICLRSGDKNNVEHYLLAEWYIRLCLRLELYTEIKLYLYSLVKLCGFLTHTFSVCDSEKRTLLQGRVQNFRVSEYSRCEICLKGNIEQNISKIVIYLILFSNRYHTWD